MSDVLSIFSERPDDGGRGGDALAAMERRVLEQVWADPPEMSVSEWADANRHLAERSSKRHGRYLTDATPYCRQPQDTCGDPRVRVVVIIKGGQLGGTTISENFMLWSIAENPGPTLWVWPSEDDAREFNVDRFTPAVEKCPAALARMSGRKQDTKTLQIKFGSMDVYFRGSNSESKLETRPCRNVIIDELDRCSEHGVDIVEVTSQRVATFDDVSKQVQTGTPGLADEGIDQAYEQCDDRRSFHVPCPHCGQYHTRTGKFSRCVRWPVPEATPENPNPHALDADPDMVLSEAWFECPSCGHAIEAHHNQWQLLHGIWLSEGESIESDGRIREIDPYDTSRDVGAISRLSWDAQRGRTSGHVVKLGGAWSKPIALGDEGLMSRAGVRIVNARERPGVRVGFHVSGLLNALVSNPYGFVAEGFVRARGNPDKSWYQRKLGEAWEARGISSIDVAELRALCKPVEDGGYLVGQVRADILAITIACDLQRDRAVVDVRGWGEAAIDTDNIEHFEIPTRTGDGLAPLDALALKRWTTQDGRTLRPWAIAVDSGDGVRTDEVYEWAMVMRARGVLAWPLKGVWASQMGAPYMETGLEGTKIERWTKAQLRLLRVNSDFWSGRLNAMVKGQVLRTGEQASDEAPRIGRFGLPANASKEYLIQLQAVHQVPVSHGGKRGSGKSAGKMVAGEVWRHKPGMDGRDHWHDATIYNLALAAFLQAPVILRRQERAARPVTGPRVIGQMGGKRESGGGGVGLVPRGRGER